MAKKSSKPFSEPRNVDTKICYSLLTNKESPSVLPSIPHWSRKSGKGKSTLTNSTLCVPPAPTRITSSSNTSRVRLERKPALIMRPESGMNSRSPDSKCMLTLVSQQDARGTGSQVGIQMRKRKSCTNVSRSRRPETIIGNGVTGRPDVRLEENGCPSRQNSTNPCKKRVEFHSQTRLDKLQPRGISVVGRQTKHGLYESDDPNPGKKDSNRYHVFSYEQVKRLDSLLQTQLCISPRPVQWDYGFLSGIPPESLRCRPGSASCQSSQTMQRCQDTDCSHPQTTGKCDSCLANNSESKCATKTNHKGSTIPQANKNGCSDPGLYLPIISMPLKQLIRTIRDRLVEEQISVREIRLNGGAAGYVINLEEQDSYSDLDVIFSVDLSNSVTFAKIKSVVFSSVAQFLAETFARGNLVYSCTQNHCATNTKIGSPAPVSTGSNITTGSPCNTSTVAVINQSTAKANCNTTVTHSNASNDHALTTSSSDRENCLPDEDRKASIESVDRTVGCDSNRSRTRCSHSFTSATDMKYWTLSLSSSSSVASHSFPRATFSRRASETSILFPVPKNKQTDPLTCVTNTLIAVPHFAADTTPSPVVSGNNHHGSPFNHINSPMTRMMSYASCFFYGPFHSFPPCVQNWTRLLRDESIIKQYIQKMVRIHKPSSKTADSWSLFTLGYRTADGGKTVDVKFVDRMQRPFEFTVDSFQIVLDSLMTFYETSRQTMDEHFYPTVVAESVAGSFAEALSHLKGRLIATPRPEEIRGGGLLKYCKLLVDGYRPSSHIDVLSMERYMCSRFFIDFPDIVSQHQRLTYYLTNHFDNVDATKATYLQILHEVVSHSTVCLMTHERQQTLCLIRMLLQDFLSRSELSKTGVHLEEFSSDNWALDSIYYGTTYFPKQLYLLPDPIRTLPCTSDLSSRCLLFADSLGQVVTPESAGAPVIAAGCKSNVNTCVTAGYTNGEDTGGNPEMLGTQDAVDSGLPNVEPMELNCNQNTSIDYALATQLDEAKQATQSDGLESHIAMDTTLTPPPTDEIENIVYNEQEYPGIDYVNDGESCFANMNTGSYDDGSVYYIPQVVTYFPTPVKYPKDLEETADTQTNADNYVCSDGITPKLMPHYHAGIILPRMESTGAAEMNHYVGVPCSDMQYAYSNYPCGFVDSIDCIPYAPGSMYCYSPDPGYLVYTNPVIQNSPTLILAYPM